MRGLKRWNAKVWGLVAYLGITVLTFAALAPTFGAKTWETLSGLDPRGLIPILLVWAFGLSADSFALLLFMEAGGARIALAVAFRNTFIRLLFNLLTPFSSGGQPFAVWALSLDGAPLGASTTAVLSKTVVYSLMGLSAALAALAILWKSVSAVPSLGSVFGMTALLGLLGVAAFLLSMARPGPLVASARALTAAATRICRALKSKRDPSAAESRILAEISRTRRAFRRYSGTGKSKAVAAGILVVLQFVSNVLLLWLILRFLGVQLPLIQGVALGSLLFFIIGFMPTPGSTGLGDALFAGVFARFVPLHMLGASILAWRFFNQYSGAVIGAILAPRYAIFGPRPGRFDQQRDREGGGEALKKSA